jgi:hypothetical protein
MHKVGGCNRFASLETPEFVNGIDLHFSAFSPMTVTTVCHLSAQN